MLETLILLSGTGLVLASRSALGVANPFQFYFLVWLSVFLGYGATRQSFVAASPEFLFAAICSTTVAIALLVANSLQSDGRPRPLPSLETIRVRKGAFLVVQAISTLALAPVLVQAQVLSGGESIFSGIGYMRLRHAMTQEGQGFGVLSYFFMPSFVLSSVALTLFRTAQLGSGLLLLSLATSFLYAYLSTGRTFFLLLFCLLFAPLVITRSVRSAGLSLVVVLLVGAFVLVGALAKKGIDIEIGLAASTSFFFETLRSYTIAPFLALSEVVEKGIDPEYGVNSLRFFVSVAYALGLTDIPPVLLVKEYLYVPDLTNVYTVYEPYVRDFLALGFIIPPAFLIVHEFLFRQSARVGGLWIFFYSASLYPLIMQFFQDQYLSLLSQWIQIAFWYVVLVKTARVVDCEARHGNA